MIQDIKTESLLMTLAAFLSSLPGGILTLLIQHILSMYPGNLVIPPLGVLPLPALTLLILVRPIYNFLIHQDEKIVRPLAFAILALGFIAACLSISYAISIVYGVPRIP